MSPTPSSLTETSDRFTDVLGAHRGLGSAADALDAGPDITEPDLDCAEAQVSDALRAELKDADDLCRLNYNTSVTFAQMSERPLRHLQVAVHFTQAGELVAISHYDEYHVPDGERAAPERVLYRGKSVSECARKLEATAALLAAALYPFHETSSGRGSGKATIPYLTRKLSRIASDRDKVRKLGLDL